MKTLYLDCFSGISGDMFIGALIDAGADPMNLKDQLSKLHIEGEYELKWSKVVKNGITGTKFDVVLKNGEALHAHEHNHAHKHVHTHEHEHDHAHEQHHHEHDHRSYSDIVALIKRADLEDEVKDTALKIFRKIGEAESLIHGISLERVHFHEVGAVDSIMDIVGAAILIHQMQIDMIKSAPIPVGYGKIRIDHGIYPVPAPATLEILKGIPLEQSNIRAELTTPTGAAIAAVLVQEYGTIPSMQVQSIGYGAGTKNFQDHPNVLRVIIGE